MVAKKKFNSIFIKLKIEKNKFFWAKTYDNKLIFEEFKLKYQ